MQYRNTQEKQCSLVHGKRSFWKTHLGSTGLSSKLDVGLSALQQALLSPDAFSPVPALSPNRKTLRYFSFIHIVTRLEL